MGIRIKTDERGVKVFRSDKFGFPQYSIAIRGQTEDGKWVNEWREIRFRRGVEMANGEEIIINDAFPTLRFWQKDGQYFHKEIWQILEFTYPPRQRQTPDQMQEPPPAATEAQVGFDDLPDTFAAAEDDIPF